MLPRGCCIWGKLKLQKKKKKSGIHKMSISNKWLENAFSIDQKYKKWYQIVKLKSERSPLIQLYLVHMAFHKLISKLEFHSGSGWDSGKIYSALRSRRKQLIVLLWKLNFKRTFWDHKTGSANLGRGHRAR